jgi:hypothetical protein
MNSNLENPIPALSLAKISKIEKICSHDVGRGITPLADVLRGNLLKAAQSIVDHPLPHIAIITGFYVPKGTPPAAETDGPIGTAHLAAGLSKWGVPVRIVSDSLCMTAVKAAVRATGELKNIQFDEFPMGPDVNNDIVTDAILKKWIAADPPVSHVVSIERVGPGKDNIPRNMRGENIEEHTAPLHTLFSNSGNRTTIGIGDGGNELGMGALPPGLISAALKNGDRIAPTASCDYLIICGVSNWGGIGLLAALSVLRPDIKGLIGDGLTREKDYHILKTMVAEGPAVDGVTLRQAMTVDGLEWEYHAKVLEKIVEVINSPD